MSRPKGSKLTKVHRQNISEALTGKQNTLEKHWRRKDIPWNKNTKGIMKSNSGSFKKGQVPWNKNLKGWMSKKEKIKRSERMKKMLAEKSPNWKGGNYGWLHKWIRRQKGEPLKCEECGSNEKVEWANKSGEYLRDIDDWIVLCKSCHHKWDKIWEKRQRDEMGRFM